MTTFIVWRPANNLLLLDGRTVTYVKSINCEGLRVIVCMRFDDRASPEEVSTFQAAVIDCPYTLHSLETTGSLDFIVELAPPDMASFNVWLTELATPISKLVEHCEKSFVCKRFVRRPKDETAIWVPNGAGFQSIQTASIDKIVANGDYIQVHAGSQRWMLHETLRSISATLSSSVFIQLHRSIIVRWAFVRQLAHEGRHWTAQLADGTSERIAKTHLAEVLLRRRLSTPR